MTDCIVHGASDGARRAPRQARMADQTVAGVSASALRTWLLPR
jgi:hypothetical protein